MGGSGPDSVDVYQLDVPLTVPDAGPALDVWTCDSLAQQDTFCNGAYDRLIERARVELDPAARSDLYAEADLVLSGATGQMPGIPLLWPDVHEPRVALAAGHVRDRPARAHRPGRRPDQLTVCPRRRRT